MAGYKKKFTGNKETLYEKITNTIIERIESGDRPFPTIKRKPGSIFKSSNLSSFKPYSGANTFLTEIPLIKKPEYIDKAIEKYGNDVGSSLSRKYVTGNQVIKEFPEGALKGKKSDTFIFIPGSKFYVDSNNKTWKSNDKNKKYPTKEEIERLGLVEKRGQSRAMAMFNVCQFIDDGIPDKYINHITKSINKLIDNPIEHMENLTIINDLKESLGVRIIDEEIKNGAEGYFRANDNSIHLKPMATYEDQDHYLSTLFHEMTHYTGIESINDRSTLKNYSKSQEIRAEEELVAEMGAAFLCGYFGIENKNMGHEAYLSSWLKALKDDPKISTKVIVEAQKSTNFIVEKYENHIQNKYGFDSKKEVESIIFNEEETKKPSKTKEKTKSLNM